MGLPQGLTIFALLAAAPALGSGCDGREPHCGRPVEKIQGIEVGMTEEQVKAQAYRDNAFLGCTGGRPYRRERWKPESAVSREGSDLFWVALDDEGKPCGKTRISEGDRAGNAFLARKGYQYPTRPITHRMLIFPDGEHCAYVYFNAQGTVEVIYFGGT